MTWKLAGINLKQIFRLNTADIHPVLQSFGAEYYYL